jgi:hypothetical protein
VPGLAGAAAICGGADFGAAGFAALVLALPGRKTKTTKDAVKVISRSKTKASM